MKMKNRLPEKLIALVLVVVLAAGCSAAPMGATQTPTPKGIGSVTFDYQEEFTEVTTDISLPVREAIQRILESAGVQVLEPGQPADAAMSFQVTFTPLKAEINVGIAKAECWNGAEATVQMSLTETGKEPRLFSGYDRNPVDTFFVITCPKVEDAPFNDVWARAVLDPLSQVWDHTILLKAVEDENAALREAALGLLNKHEPEPKEAVPAMIKALEDTNEDVISTAAFILGERKEKSAVPALSEAILRTDEASRGAIIATIYALHLIGPDAMEAVPSLITLLGDKDQFVINEAESALKAITGQDLGKDTAPWQAWWDKQ